MSDQVSTLASTITGNGWTGGLGAGGNMSALDATMKPIDQLASVGLGFLTSHVQPLQAVLDRMAGKASVIRTFAEAWQRVSAQVEQVRRQLARSSTTDTAAWRGDAGDRYRAQAAATVVALSQIVALAKAASSATTTMGQAVADGRQRAGDLLTDLITRLISVATQLIAAEGGITANVISQTTSMVKSYASPISSTEQQVRQTVDNIAPLLVSLANAIKAAPIPGSGAASQTTTTASASTAGQVVMLDPNVIAASATEPATRGLQFAQAQTTGGAQRGNTIIRLPDGKTIRVRPGGEYIVPGGSQIFDRGRQRLVPPRQGSVTLPDGTTIRFVDPDPRQGKWPDEVPIW